MSASSTLESSSPTAWQDVLDQARWYQEKAFELTSIEQVAEVELTPKLTLSVLRLGYPEGKTALYALPRPPSLGTSAARLPTPDEETTFARALGELLRDGALKRGANAILEATTVRDVSPSSEDVRFLDVQMSNVAFRFGDDSFLKVQRRLTFGSHREALLLSALDLEGSFFQRPQLQGELRIRFPSGESATLGLLLSWIENEGDLFTRATERDFLEIDPTQTRLGYAELGRQTGRLHQALARVPTPDFAARRSEGNDPSQLNVEARAVSILSLLEKYDLTRLAGGRTLAEQLLGRRSTLLGAAASAPTLPGAPLQQVHGDYHLGQLLVTRDGFSVVDFEGDPGLPASERQYPRSPLVDVAGLLRSLDYAAHVTEQRALTSRPPIQLPEPIHKRASDFQAAFLRGYAEQTGFDMDRDGPLLRAHLLDKSLAELNYELNARPEWAYIPLTGILEHLSKLEI